MEAMVTAVSRARDARIKEIEREESEFYAQRQRLKEHQVHGVQWMSAMYDCGLSCILGDEMGMGKTAQAITLIARLLAKGYATCEQPILVVVPLAVLKGWQDEFDAWLSPQRGAVDLVVYHASAALRREMAGSLIERWKRDGGVERPVIVLTTPGMLLTDFEVINGHGGRWSLVMVDEAHLAKNHASCFSKHLQAIDTESLVLITGTIVHNNIEEELLHMLSLVVPPVAKDALLALPKQLKIGGGESGLFVGEGRPSAELQVVSKVLYCFMLRRLMQGVAMPPKSSCTVYLPQTPLQKRLYGEKSKKFKEAMVDRHPFLGILQSIQLFIPQPRPSIADQDRRIMQAAEEHSAKFQFLMHILPTLLRRPGGQNKHRVLIFSTSVRLLHLLGLCLCEKRYHVDLITGDVNDIDERKQRLDRFNAGGANAPEIMLLSTKAMGQGVQLTGADTVIFFDHHDNPQNDNQAEARAYRITQQRPVLVLRLVTRGANEENAMQSWVKEKREIQHWLEFTQAIGSSSSSAAAAAAPPLERIAPDRLDPLLLDRTKSGLYTMDWQA